MFDPEHSRAALDSGRSTFERAVAAVVSSFRDGGKLLVLGNGGGTADAHRVVADLVGRLGADRPPLPAVVVDDEPGVDFERQVEALAQRGDVVLAIGAGGPSENALARVRVAARLGICTIALVGAHDSELERLAEIALVVPGGNAAEARVALLAVAQELCAEVESRLYGPALLARVWTGVVSWEELLPERDLWRRAGRTVVWTNGCFDLLHLGHLRSFEAAKQLGDVLVVGVNGDESVTRLKGPGRPVMPAEERAALVAALRPVDRVVVFAEETPEGALERLQPDIHTKGADYAHKNIPERAVVESYGGRVVLLPFVEGRSTTDLLVQRQDG